MIKAIIFDLDHTLFDRYETLKKVVPMFREKYEISKGITDEYFAKEFIYADKQYVHFGWEKILDHLVSCGIFVSPPDINDYTEFLLSCFTKVAVPFPFAKKTLEILRKNGIKTGLITNGRHEVQEQKLKMLGLLNSFDEILISGDFDFKKPDVRIFKEAAKRLLVDTSEMMYVGDHPLFDVEGSRKAGCVPVWVMTTGTWVYPEIEKPELRVNTVEEIPAIIEKINGVKFKE